MRGARGDAVVVVAPGRARPGTGVALTTLTVRVWPLVPGLSWSTLVKTGLRSAGLSPPCAAAVDMDAAWIDRGAETLAQAGGVLRGECCD